MKRTIEIVVSPTGEIRIEAVGFVGSSCKEATKALEEALGKMELFQPKPEYHQQNRQTHQQRIGT
jgi:hypothetical protein